jgi:hypothetical protein
VDALGEPGNLEHQVAADQADQRPFGDRPGIAVAEVGHHPLLR